MISNTAGETGPAKINPWRQRFERFRDRLPAKVRRALLSKKTLALFLIALIGKLAFYGVLAWQLMIRR